MDDPRGCVVVPAYGEEERIGAVVRGIRTRLDAVMVVDDGSSDATAQQAAEAGAVVIRHPVNRGKGAALETAFRAAREQGFDYVITMDGDGQHAPDDIPTFLKAYADADTPVLVGNRMWDTRSMPWIRRWTNRFMSWLLSREIGQRVPDTQCGFRLYRLAALEGITVESGCFAAESEILMALGEKGVPIGSVPVATLYGTEKSKIRPGRDTVRFFGMLWRHRNAARRRSPVGTAR